ncbi:MAG: M23 family metallopeptidase [Deltaproteobacteria bacterium]
MYDLSPRKKRGSGALKGIVALILIGAIAVGAVFTTRTGDEPTVTLDVGLPAIGPETPLTVTVAEPKRGPIALKVTLRQEGLQVPLLEQTFTPRPWHQLWGEPVAEKRFELKIDKKGNAKELRVGDATIEVWAKGAQTWAVAGPEATKSVTLPVKLVPPSVEVKSSFIYPTQGGCEAVVFEVGESAVKSGVQAGDWFFPGYPLPNGKDNERFALFAIPYDLDDMEKVKLVASDDVGNTMAIDFVDRFTAKPFKEDTINVTDRFMKIVVPKIMGKTPSFEDRGSLLKNYVAINSEMRQDNAERLVELSKGSEPKFHWNQSFAQMQAQVFSSFADRRTYMYEGKAVDKQDHLGFDLASTKKAPIPAANAGKVVLAEYFGIYGNAVVIDHGYGLMSLYGHLSSIDVKVGDTVTRAQTIGSTGATGLALGDHLHFTMLLAGLAVTPLEWWDGHWIHDRIALKLGDALGFVEDE